MHRTILILLLFTTGCSTRENQNRQEHNRFVFPRIIQNENIDTVKAFNAEAMESVYPPLIGKYKFGDTVNFSKSGEQQFSEQEYQWEVKNTDDCDSLSTDGLQVIPDYKTSIAYSDHESAKRLYFPVYIVNETYEPRVFFGKDSHGFAIQEAIDTSDYSLWHPIESTGYTICGNGRFRKLLKPKEFLLFLLPKYAGPDTTFLRIRFKIGESVFISKAFSGTINRRQFDIKEDEWIYNRLKDSKGAAANWLFYGGRPKKDFE